LAGDVYPSQPTAGTAKQTVTTKTGSLDPAKEEISVAISKLDFGIEDVSKQIKNVVRPVDVPVVCEVFIWAAGDDAS
jgi:conserved oligomeric Golgi complex subunit 5